LDQSKAAKTVGKRDAAMVDKKEDLKADLSDNLMAAVMAETKDEMMVP